MEVTEMANIKLELVRIVLQYYSDGSNDTTTILEVCEEIWKFIQS